MVWLECGHDRIVMKPVNRRRKMRCHVCKTKVGITAAKVIGS